MKILLNIIIFLSISINFAFSIDCNSCPDDDCDAYCATKINFSNTVDFVELGNGFVSSGDKIFKFLSKHKYEENLHNSGSSLPKYICKISDDYLGCSVLSYSESCFQYTPYETTCGYYNYVKYQYFTKCSSDQEFDIISKTCKSKCLSGQQRNPDTGDCEFLACPEGQIRNPKTGQCEPDSERPSWCPEPMIFQKYEIDRDWQRDLTIEKCLPNPILDDQTKCEAKGMIWHFCDATLDSHEMATCMLIPMGCYHQKTIDRFKAEFQLENDLFIIGGFMLPLPINAIKNSFISLASYVKGLFKNNPKPNIPNLLEYRPQLVDMRATQSGPEPVFRFNPVDDDLIILNNVFKETGKFDITLTTVNIPKTPQVLADVSPNLKVFDFPKNASLSGLENNTLISAKLKDMAKPMPTKEATSLNEIRNIKLDYDFDTMFKQADNPTPNLPMTIQQTGKSGNKTTYKGSITTPDNSVIDVEVVETISSSGSKVQDVILSHNYKTPSGVGNLSTGYTNTIDASGKVTNTIPKDSTVSDPSTGSTSPNAGGSTTTTPTQSLDLSTLEQALSRTNTKLDAINDTLTQTKTQLQQANDTLTDIKTQQKLEWNYDPNIATKTAFATFASELTKLDLSAKEAFTFIDNTKKDIDNLMNDFNDAKDILEKGIDIPEIPSGNCPFTISGPTPGSGKTNLFSIDPCYFVSPYRSILTIFFTIWFSFEIIMFSLKYLFRVGGDS
ncbi:hypothetical protein CCAL13119_01030 [Campylobacter sp. RM13119]|uniref:hypothetical protein n=1 Tax=Campylobacter californiensis TaxID=1032243 RepID=UPI0014749F67|nr:hypothetical protein [Campylobacter sp. RM13119]MBE3605542.1 hypothetical protein [Campylobacter sp. RM13119]